MCVELLVLLHDFKNDINAYLENEVQSPFADSSRTLLKSGQGNSRNFKRIASLKDIIQFNIDHPSPEGYNQDILIMAEATDGLNNRTYIEALESNRWIARKYLDSLLIKYKLDAIIVPCEHRGISSANGFKDTPFGNSVAAIAGYPSVVVNSI